MPAPQTEITALMSHMTLLNLSLKARARIVTTASIILLAACGDGSSGITTPPVTVSRIEVSAATTTLAPQQTVQLSAVGRTASGATVNGESIWSSTAPNIATVNASGIVTGVSAGSATIRATRGAIVGSIDVTVTSGVGVLVSIAVNTEDRTIQLGQLMQATVVGRDALGAPVALGTRTVTWSTSNPSIATITQAGVVTGVGVGIVDVQASVTDGATPKAASVQLIVSSIPGAPTTTDVFMPGLTFSPVEAIVKQGGSVRFIFPSLAHNVIWDPRLAGSPTDINTTSDMTVSRTFPTVGVFQYKCTLHPGMDGTVIVSP